MSLPKLFALILFTIVFCGIGLYYKDFILNFVMTKFFYYAVIGCLIPAILLLATFCKQIYLKLTIHYELKGTILNQKIGYFIIEEDTTLIQQVKDTKLRYNWIDRHINGHTGTLILFTNDYTDPVQYLRGIEKPDEVKNIIASLMALYANKRGIIAFGEDSAVSGDISDDINQQN